MSLESLPLIGSDQDYVEPHPITHATSLRSIASPRRAITGAKILRLSTILSWRLVFGGPSFSEHILRRHLGLCFDLDLGLRHQR